MTIERPSRPSATAIVALLSLVVVSVHLIAVLLGHEEFLSYGPVIALLLGGAAALVLARRYGAWWPLTTAVALSALLPEWLEQEVTAGHRLTLHTAGDHAPAAVAVLAVAACTAMVHEARRTAAFVRRGGWRPQ